MRINTIMSIEIAKIMTQGRATRKIVKTSHYNPESETLRI